MGNFCWRNSTCNYVYLSKLGFILIFAIIVATYNYVVISNAFNLRTVSLSSSGQSIKQNTDTDSSVGDLPPPGYLVWSDHCRMLDVDPFTPDVMAIFKPKNYTLCSDDLPLTKVIFDINAHSYVLHIDTLAKIKLVGNNDDVYCCYQSILRAETGLVDYEYKLEDCVPFYQDHVLPPEVDNVIISCKSEKMQKEVQRDAHCLVREKSEIRERLHSFKGSVNKSRPISVLMLGIDSVSRFNLRRTMPNTTHRLLQDNWFELSGYNKIADNTLPNLMALLTGYNMTTATARCKLDEIGALNDCNFMWDLFRQYGYVTGYGEDEAWMSTFNYVVKGFVKPPVDYYLRPFMLAIEKSLQVKKMNQMTFCIGLRHSAEYVYDYALELATRYRSEPYFGLFWVNTFSHNAFDDASSMDTRIAGYLEEMKHRGVLDDSIVIFFSDHGSRFGRMRFLHQGFLDERLPFIFIWLPAWFRAKHPDFVKALKANRYRLTNPYDIHMTLKHILELSGRTGKLPQAVDCPRCQSLFVPVSRQRSCRDIAIEDHWCTCTQYENVAAGKKEVLKAVRHVLDHLNSGLKSGKFIPPCSLLQLMSVDDAQMKININSKVSSAPSRENYRIRFTVRSGEAKFEATVAVLDAGKDYEIIGSVSRLDSYEAASSCISDRKAKMYCICDKK